jgi:hypothetical protein
VYEEKYESRALLFKTEDTGPGVYDVLFPSERQWAQAVPNWAVTRREEILARIKLRWKRGGIIVLDDATVA